MQTNKRMEKHKKIMQEKKSFGETLSLIGGAVAAGLVVAGVFVLVIFIFILFCTKVWFV